MIIGWAFLDEFHILPPLSLGRFFLNQQLDLSLRAKLKSTVLV